VRYLQIVPNQDLEPYQGATPFLAIVAIDEPVAPEWQGRMSQWLIESGCLYMMAWGIDCSSWDDSVDIAALEADDYADVPDERFVMTTWHKNETLSEVFDFAKRHARPASDKVQLSETVVFHISSKSCQHEFETLYAAA
jgi:hypothetical protein